MPRIHVIGAGMAGLAAAVEMTKAGRAVTLWEAAPRAGGRCRSFHDPTIGRVIDNGNHLMLGANPAVFAYLEAIGARDGLLGQERAAFPFVDLRTGQRWVVRPNAGVVPWWVLAPARRVPDSRLRHYLAGLKLAFAHEDATVRQALTGTGPLMERLWEPLTVAVLNTSVEEGAARLLWPVVRLTFGRGEKACRAYVARDGLGPNLVDPAVAYVTRAGGQIHHSQRLRQIEQAGDLVRALAFGESTVDVAAGDRVVLAVPPQACHQLLPDVPAPLETRPIVNAHFRLDGPPPLPGGSAILGVIGGGAAQWIFARGDIASVTVSAAADLVDRDADELSALIWHDVAHALDLPEAPRPPARIVKERRATFAQTPASLALRPPAHTRWRNLFLAGDWTDTGLPATIEGAIRSGVKAARLALKGL